MGVWPTTTAWRNHVTTSAVGSDLGNFWRKFLFKNCTFPTTYPKLFRFNNYFLLKKPNWWNVEKKRNYKKLFRRPQLCRDYLTRQQLVLPCVSFFSFWPSSVSFLVLVFPSSHTCESASCPLVPVHSCCTRPAEQPISSSTSWVALAPSLQYSKAAGMPLHLLHKSFLLGSNSRRDRWRTRWHFVWHHADIIERDLFWPSACG